MNIKVEKGNKIIHIKEIRKMRKAILSIGLAMAMVMATTAPAMAASSGSETANVTVLAVLSITLQDFGATNGIDYGSLTPGTNNNVEEEQTTAASPLDTGATTSAGAGTTITDSGATFVSSGVLQGMVANNTTDASTSYVVSVDSETQITTTTLTGGSDQTWASGDTYTIFHGAVAIIVEAETNVAATAKINTDAANFTGAGTMAVSNAKWDVDDDASDGTAMAVATATVGSQFSDSAADQYVNIWHTLSVPSGQAQGAYSVGFVYSIVE